MRAFKAAEDARKALIPAQPDLYKPELPKELKLPLNMEVKTDDPLYIAVRSMAHAKGWTQQDFSDAIGAYAQIEASKAVALNEAIRRRDESLGQNGTQRVDEIKRWFAAQFGPEVGAQFGETLFTAGIIKGFEQIKEAMTRQGVKPFSALGREAAEGRSDGLPDNWDKLDAVSRREWLLRNPDKRPRPTAA